MNTNKENLTGIIEFYLKNSTFIRQELSYRKQVGNLSLPVTVSKMCKPIPFSELDVIATSVYKTVDSYCGEKAEYINLRYRKNCTYDVICGLMNKKRSTVFMLGESILNDILFNILIEDIPRKKLLNSELKNYFVM